jgi:hypothetical protein
MMNALGTSPLVGSGTPITAHSFTPGRGVAGGELSFTEDDGRILCELLGGVIEVVGDVYR